jgi:soluble cytochrome b562
VQRQLSALDLLADETGSPLVRYFATTRRCMHAILVGDLDRARSLAEAAYALGSEIEVPDAFPVYHAQVEEIARHTNDLKVLVAEATLAEEYALRHGLQSLIAEVAVLWLQVGEVDRAAGLAAQVAGGGLDVVPHDVDWTLTVAKATEAGAGTGLIDIARDGVALLAPYAGRSVVNAGAVVFVGVVEDYLWHGAVAIGKSRADGWRAAAAGAYRRLGAPWWLRRVSQPGVGDPAVVPPQRDPRPRTIELKPVADGTVWSIGVSGRARLVTDMKGLHYLRALLQRPAAELTALDLSALIAGRPAVSESDLGERLDRQALAAYRQRLRDIDEELDEAEAWADTGRVERIEAEREALLRELNAATGLGGRARTTAGSAERARVAVRKAIAAALDRIEADDPPTARLLRRTVRTGSRCRYAPDPDAPVEWLL